LDTSNIVQYDGCAPAMAATSVRLVAVAHSQKQVRAALDDADAAGFKIVATAAHGHSWGYVDCPRCPDRFYLWSTPRNADNHAKQIRRFVQRHAHS
jgi:hypothetical protein